MLKLGLIPNEEPDIRVGIVLPEDRKEIITLKTPKTINYSIITSEKTYNLLHNTEIKVKIKNDKIITTIDNNLQFETKKIIIKPDKAIKKENKAGLQINEVVAGRGFHWKKFININVTGVIEISNYNNNILVINELPIEEYLMCVATSEMGSACPPELIESQTITARSWILANIEMKHVDLEFDVCNDDCCQRYQGTTFLTDQSIKGAYNTFGQVLMSDNKICDARYSKSCGGIMETYENVWEDTPISYLQGIPDAPANFQHESLPMNTEEKVEKWILDTPESFCSSLTIAEEELPKYLGGVDDEGKYFRWEVNYSQAEITKLLSNQLNIQAKSILDILPIKRGKSGRLTEIEVVYIDNLNIQLTLKISNQYYIRKYFDEKFLYSSAFIVKKGKIENNIPNSFTLLGAGWGHGVGYCQIGALGMALKGYSTENIVYHYFPGSVLKKIY